MSKLQMQSMADVIMDLNDLISKYNLQVVNHAFEYIKNFPKQPEQMIRFSDHSGNSWDLSATQVMDLTSTFKEGKIQAIKLFRQYTGCGLKEAKDAVEIHFDCGFVAPKW